MCSGGRKCLEVGYLAGSRLAPSVELQMLSCFIARVPQRAAAELLCLEPLTARSRYACIRRALLHPSAWRQGLGVQRRAEDVIDHAPTGNLGIK